MKNKQLFEDIEQGKFKNIKKGINKCTDVNIVFDDKPLLHRIIDTQKITIKQTIALISLLNTKGVDINIKNKNGDTALDLAREFSEKSSLPIIKCLKQLGATDSIMSIGFFCYKDNTYSRNKERPDNQRTPKVQKKIASRILRYQENGLEGTHAHETFCDDVEKHGSCKLKENKLTIAHNIAIKPMTEAMVRKMNSQPSTSDDERFENFADDLYSTDDESGRKNAKKIYHLLAEPKVTPEIKLEKATQLIKQMNCKSRNLMPGHVSPNCSLKEHRDPHMMLKNGKFVETCMSKILSKSFNLFWGKLYEPRMSKKDGVVKYQSSSVHKDTHEAWFRKPLLITIQGQPPENIIDKERRLLQNLRKSYSKMDKQTRSTISR